MSIAHSIGPKFGGSLWTAQSTDQSTNQDDTQLFGRITYFAFYKRISLYGTVNIFHVYMVDFDSYQRRLTDFVWNLLLCFGEFQNAPCAN